MNYTEEKIHTACLKTKKLLSHRDTRQSVSASATKDRLLIGMLALHATGLPNR